MQKNIALGLVGVIVTALIGMGVYIGFVQSDDDSSNNQTSNQSSEPSDAAATSQLRPEGVELPEQTFENNFGADLQALNEDVEITISSADTNGVLQFDDSGDVRFEATSDGETDEFIQAGGEAYFFDPEENIWYAYPFDFDDILGTFNQIIAPEAIAAYQGANDLGEVDCVSGRCNAFEVTEDGSTAVLKVDTRTNRVSEIEGSDPDTGEEVRFTFDYDVNLNIQAPENAQEFDFNLVS